MEQEPPANLSESPIMKDTEISPALEQPPASISPTSSEPIVISAKCLAAAGTTNEPNTNNCPFQSLDPRFITVERIAGWILLGVLTVLAAVGMFWLTIASWPPGIFVVVAAVACLLVLGTLAWINWILPPVSYRHASWRLDERGLDIRRGILWRHEITIPLARVQHTDVHQGPLLRRFQLANLVVHTAGTQDASVELGGLSLETAQSLRDALVAKCEAQHGR